MAFDFDGLSSIITSVGNGASSIIAATKGNVKSTTTSLGVNTGLNTSGSSGSSQLTGMLLIGGLLILAVKIFKRK